MALHPFELFESWLADNPNKVAEIRRKRMGHPDYLTEQEIAGIERNLVRWLIDKEHTKKVQKITRWDLFYLRCLKRPSWEKGKGKNVAKRSPSSFDGPSGPVKL